MLTGDIFLDLSVLKYKIKDICSYCTFPHFLYVHVSNKPYDKGTSNVTT